MRASMPTPLVSGIDGHSTQAAALAMDWQNSTRTAVFGPRHGYVDRSGQTLCAKALAFHYGS